MKWEIILLEITICLRERSDEKGSSDLMIKKIGDERVF
jgi:hypothetical protein